MKSVNNRKFGKRLNKIPRVSLRRGELKAKDNAISPSVDSTGALVLLNGMVQGTDFDERVGRQIDMVRLDLTLYDLVTATTGTDQVHRIMVVRDKQSNAAAPAITDVLVAASVHSQVNLSNAHRFVVLMDHKQVLNASAEPGSQVNISKSLGLGARTTYNAGVAGTVADITTNSLYLLVVGTNVAGATAGALFGTARLRFYDD